MNPLISPVAEFQLKLRIKDFSGVWIKLSYFAGHLCMVCFSHSIPSPQLVSGISMLGINSIWRWVISHFVGIDFYYWNAVEVLCYLFEQCKLQIDWRLIFSFVCHQNWAMTKLSVAISYNKNFCIQSKISKEKQRK